MTGARQQSSAYTVSVTRKTDDIADRASNRASGILGAIKDRVADALGATRSRVDLFQADVEHRLFRMIAMIIWTMVAVFCLSTGIILAMAAIIFGFDLPPKYAFGIPALVLLTMGLVALLMLRIKKGSKSEREKRAQR